MADQERNAFEYLQAIDMRFSKDEGAYLLESDQALHNLHFKINQYDLLLALNVSTEVINHIDYAVVPQAKPWFMGVASRRGELMMLVDLNNYLFDTDPVYKFKNKRIIVTKIGPILLGLVVDQVVGIVSLYEMHKEDLSPDNWDKSLLPMVSNFYSSNDECYGLCDFSKLIESGKFSEMQETI